MEDYAQSWVKGEDVDFESLSEWVKAVGIFVKTEISKLKRLMRFLMTRPISNLSNLHNDYVHVQTDKASNNVGFI